MTRLTLEGGQLVRLDMQDGITNGTRFDALEFLVDIVFP
jgi:hypothetical protein